MSHPPSSPDLANIVRQVGQPGQPETICKAVTAAIRAAVGCSFVTVLLVRPDGAAQRVYSSNLVAYPLPFSKPFPEGLHDRVLVNHESLLVRNLEEYRTVFFREDVFTSTGAQSLLTLPVLYDGRAVAAICIGAPEGTYDDTTAVTVQPLVAVLGPVMALLQTRPAQ